MLLNREQEQSKTLIHEDQCGKLWEIPDAEEGKARLIEVVLSGYKYFLRVPPYIDTAETGYRWTRIAFAKIK